MAVLVTGATGHAGRETVRQAVAAGAKVVAQYRKTSPDHEARELADVTWVQCELSDAAAVAALCETAQIDACIHLAAVPSDKYAKPQPLATVHTNVVGTANLLETARRQNWRRFIYVSTGSVFQNSMDPAKPILENIVPSPTNVYSTTKYCGELLTSTYRSEYEVSAAVVRISWVYGPPLVSDDPPRGPVPAFLKSALVGKPIRLPSGADFAASFTYVDDVAAGLLAACQTKTLNHAVYHLGSGENYTARRVADAVRAVVPNAVIELGAGTEPWTNHSRMRGPLAGDRLFKDTGFRCQFSLEDGVRAFADWLRGNPAFLQ